MTRTQEDIFEAFMQKFREARGRLAQAKKALKYHEESRGRIVALAMQAAAQRGVKSVAGQEREAKAGAAFKKWIDDVADAVLEETAAWTEVMLLEKQWDKWREQSWTKRAEMKLTGGSP
jgi:hypothetical protein